MGGREGVEAVLIDHQLANFIEPAEQKCTRDRQGLAVEPSNGLGITSGHDTGAQERRIGIVDEGSGRQQLQRGNAVAAPLENTTVGAEV